MALNEGAEVEIIERRELKLPGPEGEPVGEWWITYRYGRLPPGLVRIKSEQYTPETEKAFIKADIQKRLAQKTEKVKV